MSDIQGILTTLQLEADPSLAPVFPKLAELHAQKLWHQLTLELAAVFAAPASHGIRLRLYHRFVTSFGRSILPVVLVEFLLRALAEEPDAGDRAAQYAALAAEIDDTEAALYVLVLRAHERLAESPRQADATLARVSAQLDALDGVDMRIRAAYYDARAEQAWAAQDYTHYYRTGLLYLAAAQGLSADVLAQRGYRLAVAGLLAKGVYNYGELLVHELLATLAGTPHAWLAHALQALNLGLLQEFDRLMRVNLASEPMLAAQEPFLRQKVCIMALVELVFKKPSHQRRLVFAEIATATRLQEEDVEHLVMKALSLGLLKGHIDEVRGEVVVTWVQPRVLSRDQVRSMGERLHEWDARVGELGRNMEVEGKGVWV